MTEAYDGRQVVGMDLRRRRSVLVRMTGGGRTLETVRISNSPAALRREIARAGEHPRVVLKATNSSPRSPGRAARIGPAPSDQAGMPAQQGLRGDDEPQLAEMAAGSSRARAASTARSAEDSLGFLT